MRKYLTSFVVLAAFINAVPAIGMLVPIIQEPIGDEIMGSGREISGQTPIARPARRTGKTPDKKLPDSVVSAGRRLLLVEDNERLAALLLKGLTAAGFTVEARGTVDDASAALRSDRFDVVMLDRGLPDGDGLSVLAEMRARSDPTPVLVVTARAGIDDRAATFRSGANDFLAKPFGWDELVGRLHALMRPEDRPA